MKFKAMIVTNKISNRFIRYFLLKIISILFIVFTFSDCSHQNVSRSNNLSSVEYNGFYDSAHHWYDINDEEKIITPNPDQKRYALSDLVNVADNILLFQKSNGGWPKNYDMLAVLTPEQKTAVLITKNELNTTFDNGATHSHLNYLAKAYANTKNEKYKNAFIHGIEFILSAQYENGGWPQFYPDTSGYRKYITFNDGAMIGIMNLLKGIIENKYDYYFLDESTFNKVNSAYQKGIECILNCQIWENGELTAWCQQHDNINFKPRDARTFEPAAICNGESSSIVKFLMSIEEPNEEIKQSIKSAVKWFEDSRIFGIRVDFIKAPKVDYKYHVAEFDRVVVEDSDAPPIWTRFYEIGTRKPLFCNRDGRIVYSLQEVERERRTGYAWYVYDPQEILDLYPEWMDRWMNN